MLPQPKAPFVGRQRELVTLVTALDAAKRGRGSVHLLAGESGVGKTRLTEAIVERARERGFLPVVGHAYPVESGIPYALFGDGFGPLLRGMEPASLQSLSRGALAELAVIIPTLRADGAQARSADGADLRLRVFDAFTQLLYRLAAKQPILVVLENLHWADPTSLDLFHFISRTAGAHPVMLLATYNDAQFKENRSLRLALQSLTSLDVLQRYLLPPLTPDECAEFIASLFGEARATVGDFADRVHARTRGNVFFIEETLKALIRAGELRREGDRWHGWSTETLSLPDSIRDVLSLRYDALSEAAQGVVQMAAVVAVNAPHALLTRLTGLDEDAMLTAIDELRKDRILEEVELPDGPAYAFTHPMMQDMLYAEISRARRRRLHARIADTLEAMYGERAAEHAEELAAHFARADDEEQAERALRYLTLAGRNALARGAGREASEVLAAALRLAERRGDPLGLEQALELYARARHRVGDYAGAASLLERAVELATARDAQDRIAVYQRRLGATALRRGDFEGALRHQERGRAAAALAHDEPAEAALRLARSAVMMEIGRGEDARREALLALDIATRLGSPQLLGRVHQALQTIAVWRGPSAQVAEYGARALEHARVAKDGATLWQAEWVFSLHAGLTGDSAGTSQHLKQAMELAGEMRSPVLRLWTDEVAIEYRSAIGDWNESLAIADRAIEEARVFGQRLLLPRLLVWSALVHCGRGNFEEAKRRIDEAWELSGADRPDRDVDRTVHTVVPAHVGLGYYHLYRREYRAALDVGERGLEIADRTGYEVWGVHRLLPLVGEASLWLREFDSAQHYGERLLEASSRLGHPLAKAWSDACFALSHFLQHYDAAALAPLSAAADALDAIPFVEHAARLRRKYVDALLRAGHADEARVQLLRIHDVFVRLQATPALEDAREKMRELKIPLPPLQVSTPGRGSLTGREVEVARLAAEGNRDKEIAVALGMSERTVNTHLTNIYRKLGVTSRTKLANRIRELGL